MTTPAQWTEGDTAGDVQLTFSDSDGPVDFTGQTVLARFTRLSDNMTFHAALLITDPASGSGVVPLILLPTPAGTYAIEAVEQFTDGSVATIPTAGGLRATVRARETQ